MKIHTHLKLSLVSAFLTFALLAGCDVGSRPLPSGQEVVERMRETLNAADTGMISADFEIALNKSGLRGLVGDVMSVGGDLVPRGGTGMALEELIDRLPLVVTGSAKGWGKSPDSTRLDVESLSIPGFEGVVVTVDSKKLAAYSPVNFTRYTLTRKTLESTLEEASVRLNRLGIGQIYDPQNPRVTLDRVIEVSDITVAAVERVGDRDTYKLLVTPRPDASERLGIPEAARMFTGSLLRDLQVTVWVDTERWVPVKGIVEHASIGSVTFTAGVVLNEPLPESAFEVEIPGSAARISLDEEVVAVFRGAERDQPVRSVTLEQARELALAGKWQLLEPSYLPPGFTLVQVAALGGTGAGNGGAAAESIVLSYSSPQSDFRISQIPPEIGSVEPEDDGRSAGPTPEGGTPGQPIAGSEPPYFSNPDARAVQTEPVPQEISVRGVTGMLAANAGGTLSLAWVEKISGVRCVISGVLTQQEIIRVAEGLR